MGHFIDQTGLRLIRGPPHIPQQRRPHAPMCRTSPLWMKKQLTYSFPSKTCAGTGIASGTALTRKQSWAISPAHKPNCKLRKSVRAPVPGRPETGVTGCVCGRPLGHGPGHGIAHRPETGLCNTNLHGSRLWPTGGPALLQLDGTRL